MALTISTVRTNIVGNQIERIVDVTFDNSYPTGGEAFTPNAIDNTRPTGEVFWFVAIEGNDATIADNRIVTYDYTNKTLLVYTAINTQATNASDQSAVKIRCLCRYGTGAV